MEAAIPKQYTDGAVNFFGYDIAVTPDVLIPRPETEILVENVIELVRRLYAGRPVEILDMCAGSGNIAISLTKELKESKIVASDISEAALAVAEANAARNGVRGRINFVSGDLFDNIKGLFDIIAANPPYIARHELSGLPPEVLAEPKIALDGGRDGLEIIRRIVEGAPAHIRTGGYLFLEIGYGQSEAVKGMIAESGSLELTDIIKDYSGIDRIAVARNHG